MIPIYDSATMQRVLAGPIDPDLKAILLQRLDLLQEYLETYDFGELLTVLIVQPGDSIEAIETELTFSPLVCLEGYRFPDSRFTSGIWEFIIKRTGYFEMTMCLCDSGLGHLLILPDRDGVDPTLLELCRTYAAT